MKEYNPGDLIVFKADSFLLDEEDPGSCPAGIIADVELRTYGRYAAYVIYPDDRYSKFLYHFEELARWEKTGDIEVYRVKGC